MNIGIEPNQEMIDAEFRVLKVFIASYIEKVKEMNLFDLSRLGDLEKLLEDNLQPFSRIETLTLLNRGKILSAKEKKDLNLNTRFKIRSELLGYLILDNVNKAKPFESIEELDSYARARAWSDRDINKAKKLKSTFINLTVIEEFCPQSKKMEGRYHIDDAKLLPLATCGKKCLCMYLIEISW